MANTNLINQKCENSPNGEHPLNVVPCQTLYLGGEGVHAVLEVAHRLEDVCGDGGEDHVHAGLCAEAGGHLQQSVCTEEETADAYLPAVPSEHPAPSTQHPYQG